MYVNYFRIPFSIEGIFLSLPNHFTFPTFGGVAESIGVPFFIRVLHHVLLKPETPISKANFDIGSPKDSRANVLSINRD
jgi:hypothetical protein